MSILMNSGGSPHNYRKHVKILKNGHLGGSLEKYKTNVLGTLKIVKKLSTYCPGSLFWQYFDKIWTRPSAASQRGAAVKNMVKIL